MDVQGDADARPAIVMKVFFRADASLQIGTGHIMRCLTLADTLTAEGVECHFICRDHPGNLIDLVRRRGFQVHVLPADADWVPSKGGLAHAAWLGSDWQTDAQQSECVLKDTQCDWLIVDHYALDSCWESALQPYYKKLMVIDDLADRHHACSLLLDQNWHGDKTPHRYNMLLPPNAVRLLGPQYALLRPEYAQLRSLMPPRDGLVRRVLVFMGGSDPTNQTAKVLQALMHRDLSWIAVDVIVGTNHPDPSGLAALAEARSGTIIHTGLPSLAGLMARADLMISAGGSTTWERLCLGLPCLVVSIADNQTATQLALASSGFSRFIGEMERVTTESILEEMRWALHNQHELVKQSQSGQSLVARSGATRVSAFIRDITYASALSNGN
ncbi:UDP-2,4-diacetamido-2,4,6-trideoxy-beta-L-altropyranose hydrolase [Castellaniella sp.]|uniref:UDP-2,4-diacetamido-2,4, 6-trideoxy-beta-L-altropyranose hydrolase n=1 Tax=Castellaniella sp. TaxID=1955812 RepID=UPI003A93E912